MVALGKRLSRLSTDSPDLETVLGLLGGDFLNMLWLLLTLEENWELVDHVYIILKAVLRSVRKAFRTVPTQDLARSVIDCLDACNMKSSAVDDMGVL